MRLFTAVVAIVLGATLGQPALAADTNKEKIVGNWKVTKSDEKLPDGLTIEFTKAGKVLVHFELNGKSFDMEIGSYTVDGDKVTLTTKKGDMDDTEVNTIKSLTADKMTLVDPKKKETELERVKSKK